MKLCLILVFALGLPSSVHGQTYSVTVMKAERKLYLYEDGKAKKSYPIALGTAPTGHKTKQGDRKTPEGTYYICRKNPRSQFYLSLGLSYPNKRDADSAYASKLITRRERDKIKRAIDRGDCPPWDTALGGEIFIHGNGSTPDWTWGCVALDDTMIKELYDLLPLGTQVQIEP